MNDTEHLIRAALAKQAERAPHSGRIRHALDKPRRRRPWLLVIVGALVAAVAVAIPVAVSGNDPQPPATIPPAPLPSDAVRMKYKSTYLPEGVTEGRRTSADDGSLQSRHWSDGKLADFSVSNATGDQLNRFRGCTTGTVINVNGHSAQIVQGTGGAWEVSWMATQDTCVMVGAQTEELALQVARSVRPDGEAILRPPLRFGWLPPDLTHKTTIIGSEKIDNKTVMIAGIVVESDHLPGGPSLLATVGQPGRVPVMNDSKTISQSLPDGRIVRVDFSEAPAMAPEQKQHLVNSITAVEGVDLSWLGP